MKFLIEVSMNKCIHVKEYSRYNHNYYQLPFMINYCEYILEEYDSGDNFVGFELGEFDENNKFKCEYYLNTEEINGCIIIDSDKMSKENLFT